MWTWAWGWAGDPVPTGVERLEAQGGVEVEDDNEPGALDQLLATCEGISARLRARLGDASQDRLAPAPFACFAAPYVTLEHANDGHITTVTHPDRLGCAHACMHAATARVCKIV